MEKEIVSQVQEAQRKKKREREREKRGTKSPIQDKPKEKHVKTHTNQTNKDKTQRILKATSNIQGKPHMLNS